MSEARWARGVRHRDGGDEASRRGKNPLHAITIHMRHTQQRHSEQCEALATECSRHAHLWRELRVALSLEQQATPVRIGVGRYTTERSYTNASSHSAAA